MKENQTTHHISAKINWQIFGIGLGIALCGLFFVWLAAHDATWWSGREIWQSFSRDIGSLLTITAGLTVIWEIFNKRAFLDEIIAKTNLSASLKFAGLTYVTDSFKSDDIEWKQYFQNTQELKMFLGYGRTWRNTYLEEIKRLILRNGNVTVILPDHNDSNILIELSRRFELSTDEVKKLINESATNFYNLNKDGTNNIKIVYVKDTPQYSCYKFDNVAVIALYDHSRTRKPVPTFICSKGGTLYTFLESDLEYLEQRGEIFNPSSK